MFSLFRLATNLDQQIGKIIVRQKHHKHNKKYLYNDGVVVNQISYYPRDGTNEIPKLDTAPSKLFQVRRLKPIKGLPHWEKRILRGLGLYEKNAVAIVKNIPENNARLWKVKHAVEVLPITFKYGEPTEADINRTFLKENGECVVIPTVECVETIDNKLEATHKVRHASERMDGETLRKDSRLKWLNPW